VHKRHVSTIRAALGLALLASSSGCFKATFQDPSVARGAQHEQWRHRFLLGLVGNGDVDARTFCPDGRIAAVRTGGNLATSAATVLTLFVYTPRKVYVTCAADEPMRTARARATDRRGEAAQ
jgi:hypothetical protein